MGIKTVAVYSSADKNALHVQLADESVCIGAAPSNESYLQIQNIVDAAKLTNSNAVHPGYGFLSENPEFPSALEAEGISFVGPPSNAVRVMGDKIKSKKLAFEAGVSTVPGYLGQIESEERALEIALEIGFPIMIKASAGGGGKGMRIAYNEEEVAQSFAASKSEALKSFGDDTLFVEKFVSDPHHIEIQILGDKAGNFVFFGERECSIQRRNQKVVEEAPSPFLSDSARKAMGEQAISLAKAVGYNSVGTVEFIVDKNQNFYFLEMNTRLQVEHPVTELIYGVDLVELMIEVSFGRNLKLDQTKIEPTGWAIESRIYAEDPFKNFLPSIGRLKTFRPPKEEILDKKIVRNDTGVFEGGEISVYYDPMISKLCTWAPNRADAIEAMRLALDHYQISGIGHNLPFLSAVLEHPEFLSGNYTTSFIANHYDCGFNYSPPSKEFEKKCVALAACIFFIDENRKQDFNIQAVNSGKSLYLSILTDKKRFDLEVFFDGSLHHMSFDDGHYEKGSLSWKPGEVLISAKFDKFNFTGKVEIDGANIFLTYREVALKMRVFMKRHADLVKFMITRPQEDTSKLVLCPMPGLLSAIFVKAGDLVEVGQQLCVVEAMKMENVLKAEKKGIVKTINVVEGSSLAVDETILEFE